MFTIFFILPLLPVVFSQFGLKPDVIFGESNDRFDIPELMAQEKYARGNEDEDYEYRRNANNLHDSGDDTGGTQQDYLNNLRALQPDFRRKLARLLNSMNVDPGKTRRSENPTPDQRSLMENTVPLDFIIDGYLTLPDE